MSRTERNAEIDRLRTELQGVRHAVLIHYRGITVPEVTELRAQIRKSGGHYEVVKNTLLERAIAGAPLERLKPHLEGPTALIWSDAEPVAVAKTLTLFAKTVPALKVRALLLDGEPLAGDHLDQVAALPTKDELRGRLVGLLASPLKRLATVLAGPSRGMVTVLGQRAEKIKE